ncbi:TPA: beta family protein [Vibrio alginolyticus]
MNIKIASYVPLISLKPAEMAALEELYDCEKNQILPAFSLKRWATCKSFDKSMDRIEKAFGKRPWIADVDDDFLNSLESRAQEEGAAKVFLEFQELLKPNDGYKNWVEFIKKHEHIIPTVRLQDLEQLDKQLNQLLELERTIVVRLKMAGSQPVTIPDFNKIIQTLSSYKLEQLFLILDYGDLTRINLIEHHKYTQFIQGVHKVLPKATIAFSGTSFPYSFGRSYRGEVSIFERLIFNKIVKSCEGIKLIYSDRASARAEAMGGGGGLPPPRIDYALKNDWRFIRKEFDDENEDEEKEELYQEAAQEMMKSDYWIKDLKAWGQQMIEKTSEGNKYGINSAQKATAVRINLHLYQQIHYFEEISELDTEEDWED